MAKRTKANSDKSSQLIQAAKDLAAAVSRLEFGEPVTHVYNPLTYAWRPHEAYLRKFGGRKGRIVFLGMNPGPFGMAQTGVPFGEIQAVRKWLGIEFPVGKPPQEHPKRPISGFDCVRSEVSGQRLWGLFAQRYGSAEAFFAKHMVLNYCPLVFIEQSGRNRTPDKLQPGERTALFAACDNHLRVAIEALNAEWLIGIGEFAYNRSVDVFTNGRPRLGKILHPSPASPAANRNWSEAVTRQLRELGIWTD